MGVQNQFLLNKSNVSSARIVVPCVSVWVWVYASVHRCMCKFEFDCTCAWLRVCVSMLVWMCECVFVPFATCSGWSTSCGLRMERMLSAKWGRFSYYGMWKWDSTYDSLSQQPELLSACKDNGCTTISLLKLICWSIWMVSLCSTCTSCSTCNLCSVCASSWNFGISLHPSLVC